MDIIPLIERIGEAPTAALFGLITGLIFGIAAQRSRFCLRAASVEFARGLMKDKVAVWFLTFSTALVWVQGAQLLGLMETQEARMMAVPGSWSGAIINWWRRWKRLSGRSFTRVVVSLTLALPRAPCCANWWQQVGFQSPQP